MDEPSMLQSIATTYVESHVILLTQILLSDLAAKALDDAAFFFFLRFLLFLRVPFAVCSEDDASDSCF